MKNSEQYISSRTRRNVARFHQDSLPEDLQKRYDEVHQPPPLAESLIQSAFSPPQPHPPYPPREPLIQPSEEDSDQTGKAKKKGMFGFIKKFFKRKKAIQVNLNDFGSVSSKDSAEKKSVSKKLTFPKTTLTAHAEKAKADGDHSVNSNEVSGGSSASEVFSKMKSATSIFSNVSNESDKTSLSEHSEHLDDDEVDDDFYEDPSPNFPLRMTFSRDEDDIQRRVTRGEFSVKIPKLRPDPRAAGMMKLSADSEEGDISPKLPMQSSTLTSHPTFSSSAEEGEGSRILSPNATTTTETSPINRTSSSLSPAITVTKAAPTVTIAADVMEFSQSNPYSTMNKLKSEKNLKRAQQSTRNSRSFMVRPGKEISAVSPLNRIPSSLEPEVSPSLWRPTSQPVLSQQPHVHVVPRYNSTSAIPTAKPTEEFLAGVPYQPAFQSFYAKSFYIPKSPTASTAMAMHEFNYPPPLTIPTYSEYGFPLVDSNLPTNTTSRTTNPATTPGFNSFYVPSSPYPRAPATALRRKNSARYEMTEQSHYGEMQQFNSLSQFFNAEPFINPPPPRPPISNPPAQTVPPPPPPAVVQPLLPPSQPHSVHSRQNTSSSASYDPSLAHSAPYDYHSDYSEDHSTTNEPAYIEFQRQRERKYEAEKKKREIERINETALREAIQLSLEEKSVASNRTKQSEEIERANEEALRMALILSMREVRGISHQSIDTLTNSSGSYNTNRTSLTKNPSGLGSGNASKAQSRPHSRASNFPTEEYHYTAYKHPHVPSSASATHSHSPSPTPSSIPGAANFPTSLHPQMKKISSGTLSIGAQSRESRASSTANYSASVLSSSNTSETQPQRRTRKIQRVVLDKDAGAKYSGLNL
eukprot:CAMPEP_0173138502 /NCGR_PEP_ID=MMETSP1105-20130129/3728_1 /TAXON_ID=2985 /ORGANISM="Ochromonas sp., Strain BG-1" /LENGTH=865 /DNA_ID=CAMNT_0014051109 /DNA_START=304 /DNA_END=2901 /DNA_ORIENTATION=-